jgi:hypothetical protein
MIAQCPHTRLLTGGLHNMPRDPKELGDKLSDYADTITAFTFVQSAAFSIALGTNESFVARAIKMWWAVPLGIMVANVLYAYLVHTCHRGEDALLGPLGPPGDVWEEKVRAGRMLVIGLGLSLCLLAFGATLYGSRHSAPQPEVRCPMGKP